MADRGRSRSDVASGSGTTGKRPTLKDVAELAEVDRAVVSRVLSDDATLRVRDETRSRVLDAVDRLGYRRNALARGLRTARAEAFGLVVPEYANPVYAHIIQGVSEGAAAQGAGLLTVSDETLRATGQSALDLLRDGRVDGLLLAGSIGDIPVKELKAHGRCVSVNRRIRGFNRWIVLNDEGAVRLAVDHLAELGHRRIAHVAGPPSADTATRRARAFRDAVAGLTGEENGEVAVVAGSFTPAGGHEAMAALLRTAPRPTAVVVANVTMAIGALRAATEAGIAIPEQLSVVALHDLPLADFLVPALTTVSMPLHALGRRAVEVLASTSAHAKAQVTIDAPMDLVSRASTAEVSRARGRRRR